MRDVSVMEINVKINENLHILENESKKGDDITFDETFPAN